MLADVDARNIGRNRLELAAELGWRGRLQVIHVDMTRPTAEPEENHGGVFAHLTLSTGSRRQSQVIRQAQSGQAEEPDAEKAAAVNAIAAGILWTANL